jgi:hypothetical protein
VTRVEYRTPPAEYLQDIDEPAPAGNTIGAKLENRLDLRAWGRTLRDHVTAIREWSEKVGGSPDRKESSP